VLNPYADSRRVGPDLKPVIDTWTDWVAHKQFRLKDGTLARQRPQAESLWADDAYMGIPAFIVTLAGMFLARGLCYVISVDTLPPPPDSPPNISAGNGSSRLPHCLPCRGC